MDKLNWCKKQKTGIKIINRNDNLCEEYVKKAENALRAVQNLGDNPEWQISSAYYAMYFSLYAILMKIGIKCEIHSCSIEIMKELLHQYFTEDEIDLVQKSLTARIDVQYYVDRIIEENVRKNMALKASEFHLSCKEVISKITIKEINEIRSKLK